MLGVAVDGWARPDSSSGYSEMRLVVGCNNEAVTALVRALGRRGVSRIERFALSRWWRKAGCRCEAGVVGGSVSLQERD